MKIIAVIPVFNEEVAIAGIAKETQKHCDHVIVVDDCSQDRTAEVLMNLPGVSYIKHSRNKGQGAATQTGITAALMSGANIIVTLDGDGQHDPTQIPLLLDPLLIDGGVDVVMGSRFMGTSTAPMYRRFGVGALTWLFNFGHKQKVTDSLLCFRSFRSEVFQDILIKENGFGFCPEMLIKIRHKGFRILEIPVNCTYHKEYSQNSTFNPIKLATILAWKTVLWRMRVEH